MTTNDRYIYDHRRFIDRMRKISLDLFLADYDLNTSTAKKDENNKTNNKNNNKKN